MLRRNGPVVKSVESVLRASGTSCHPANRQLEGRSCVITTVKVCETQLLQSDMSPL